MREKKLICYSRYQQHEHRHFSKNSRNFFILISILDQDSYGISPCSRSMESPTCQETMILRNASRVVEKGSSLLYNLKCCSSVWSKILSGGRQKRELLPHDLSAGWQPNVCSKQTSWMQSRFPYLKVFFLLRILKFHTELKGGR